MMETLQSLIHALREELQQYGEMLARLDFQQELLMRRAAENLLETVAGIEAQGAVIRDSRQEREVRRRDVARALLKPDATPFAELIALLPVDYRPLVGALVAENNELLFRVQQRSRQNHLLLARTLELMQRFMNGLFLASTSPVSVYDGTGVLPGRAMVPAHALYEAVG